MKARDKAEQLVNEYRYILMSEDTDCGHEILCTTIAKRCASFTVDQIIDSIVVDSADMLYTVEYWKGVKQEIEQL